MSTASSQQASIRCAQKFESTVSDAVRDILCGSAFMSAVDFERGGSEVLGLEVALSHGFAAGGKKRTPVRRSPEFFCCIWSVLLPIAVFSARHSSDFLELIHRAEVIRSRRDILKRAGSAASSLGQESRSGGFDGVRLSR